MVTDTKRPGGRPKIRIRQLPERLPPLDDTDPLGGPPRVQETGVEPG